MNKRNTTTLPRIGIIGGSGLQNITGLDNVEQITLNTPYGLPSSPITLGTINNTPIAFLQRHGLGHTIPPSKINVRANISALKHFGCNQILSLSAVGSLDEDVPPGTFVVIDQFIDRTIQREKTFFGPGLVGHVPFGDPVCNPMGRVLFEDLISNGIPAKAGGTYVVMEGPQFSTRAESSLYRSWGGTVIGMTGMPEAKLAREAEACYSIIAIATDFDCWYTQCEDVTASIVSARMKTMSEFANKFISSVSRKLLGAQVDYGCSCANALDTAIMTSLEQRDPEMLSRFEFMSPRIHEV